jgi:hypothetical protein
MLRTLDAPCWHLAQPNGANYDEYDTGEGTRHFGSQAAAQKYADDYHNDPTLTPKPFPAPCVLIICDGCGAEPEDDAWATIHFPDEKAARSMADCYDYRIEADTAGPKVFCPDCPAKLDEDD